VPLADGLARTFEYFAKRRSGAATR